jgi:ribokinase
MGRVSLGRVLVLGSINRDLVIGVARHPRPGETVAGTDLREFPGGKGANQAVAARRAGAETMLVGAIGADGFGVAMRAFLEAEKIDLGHLKTVEGLATGVATITVDEHGENAIVVASGANRALTPEDAAALTFAPGDHVVAQFEVPERFIAAGFTSARAAGAVTILNPAPMLALSQAMLALTDILILNETELEIASGGTALADEAAIEAAAVRLCDGVRHVIVTLGAAGCLAATPTGVIRIPGLPAKVVDTTGAGDCFVGNLAAALSEGLGFPEALTRAGRAAAISVARPGAASSMPYRNEL